MGTGKTEGVNAQHPLVRGSTRSYTSMAKNRGSSRALKLAALHTGQGRNRRRRQPI